MQRTSDVRGEVGEVGEFLARHFGCNGSGELAVLREVGAVAKRVLPVGPDAICHGRCAHGKTARHVSDTLYDASEALTVRGSVVELPFDPREIVDNLRCERYTSTPRPGCAIKPAGVVQKLYYGIRPLLGVSARRHIQRFYFRGWENIGFPRWPVDRTVDTLFERLLLSSMRARNLERLPFIWFWPEGLPSCTMMTHDVETTAGLNMCPQVMDLNDSFGIKSPFHIIPEKRYRVEEGVLETIRSRGFEIDVHDLNHDGLLMSDHEEFRRRVKLINGYGKQFGAEGFRTAVMYRNLDWFDELDFADDMSIPNVAHLDPQQGGCCTILPFFAGNLLDLGVTTTQDYTLFHVLNEYSLDLWKIQIAMIGEMHGLISFIIHPDYNIDIRARRVYAALLEYLAEMRAQKETWVALPREVAKWSLRSKLKLVEVGGDVEIEGEGEERAQIAYAVMRDGRLSYDMSQPVKGRSAV